MPRRHPFISSLAILAAATIGVGIFSLPFVFEEVGPLTGIAFLVILAVVIATAHALYYEALEKAGRGENIVLLARTYFGKAGTVLGFGCTVIGLLLALVVLLVVGSRFLHIFLPFLSPDISLIIFWIAGSLFLLNKPRSSVALEIIAVSAMAFVVVFLVIAGFVHPALRNIPWGALSPLAAFGPILFALSGWTAVEPVQGVIGNARTKKSAWKLFFLAAFLIAAIYLLFVSAIFRLSFPVTPDTLSGVAHASSWAVSLLSFFGALAIFAEYFPLGSEAVRSLSSSLAMPLRSARMLIVFLPIAFIMLAGGNFLTIIGITGGIFISIQYLLILAVSRAAKRLQGMKLFLWHFATLVFALALLGEAYYLVFV